MRRLLLIAVLLAAPPATAASYEIDAGESLFAVVTRKAGFAAGLAHDHLIVAGDYTASLEFLPDEPERAGFRLEARTEALEPDEPASRKRWQPRLIELGILDEVFEDVSEKQRTKIRRAMLGEGQLDAAAYPRVVASTSGIEPLETVAGFGYRVQLALDVRGVRVVRPVAARYEIGESGRLTVEAFGSFRFSDFGIEPYSAMLGAVRNRDEFRVYVHLVGIARSEAEP